MYVILVAISVTIFLQPTLSDTVNAFLSPEKFPLHSNTSPDITDPGNSKDKDTDVTSTTTSENSFSVIEDINSLQYPPAHHLPTMVSADTSFSMLDSTMDRRSDVTSLSTEASYTMMRDKV